MKNVISTVNVNTAVSRQARFSFAGFYCYAYYYFSAWTTWSLTGR